MKRGERNIIIGIVALSLVAMFAKGYSVSKQQEPDKGIPFYSTATKQLETKAVMLIRKYECRNCHVFWAKRTIMQSVPAPSLDGIGSIRDEQWLYNYFSATDPQSILPSRLKKEFQMPSFSHMTELDRKLLSQYIASLKVEDWYLNETKKSEYEKLTGKKYMQ